MYEHQRDKWALEQKAKNTVYKQCIAQNFSSGKQQSAAVTWALAHQIMHPWPNKPRVNNYGTPAETSCLILNQKRRLPQIKDKETAHQGIGLGGQFPCPPSFVSRPKPWNKTPTSEVKLEASWPYIWMWEPTKVWPRALALQTKGKPKPNPEMAKQPLPEDDFPETD